MSGLKTKLQTFFGQALAYIARRYLRKFQPRVVVIAGSIGKTATTQAIATVLGEQFSVRVTRGNYNTATGVPLSILGEKFPTSPIGWALLLPRLWLRSFQRQPFDMLVLEIGTDHPGELQQFTYLQPELGIITAVAPEHMEYFETIDAVAKEELSIGAFCRQLVINRDMVRPVYVKKYVHTPVQFVGKRTDYHIARTAANTVSIRCGKLHLAGIKTHLVGEHSLHGLLVAATVGSLLGMEEKMLRRGLHAVKPLPGRMQLLEGKKHSKIIDDTYNASPEAVIAALNTLYDLPGKQRIALLGNMNELGKTSARAHRTIGAYCDPAKLDLVVTLGPDANTYTAPAARRRGCEVLEAESPYEAGAIILQRLKTHAAILAKGSQNGVFAEEAVKLLLKHPADSDKLVRQTPYWLATKHIAFPDSIAG